MIRHLLSVCLMTALLTLPPVSLAAESAQTYRSWIEEMKQADRGPFERLRWFCNDGSVLPPKPYACSEHGGGHQHGQWSERTRELRDNGYYIANVLAGVDGDAWLADPAAADQYAQLVIERFLVGADDGWIFRRALFYRGAIQEEDERAGGRDLLLAMAADPYWIGPGFAALRTGAKLIPHGADNASIDRIRQLSASLSDNDAGFRRLRAKIHGAPDAGDAERVRAYASDLDGDAAAYAELADEIDAVYAGQSLNEQLAGFLDQQPPPALREVVKPAVDALAAATDPMERIGIIGYTLADLRDAVPGLGDAAWRLAAVDLGLGIENEFFRTAANLRAALPTASRANHITVLDAAAAAAYGSGLFNRRLLNELDREMASLKADDVPLDEYRDVLAFLGRAPGWGTQALRMHFYESMETMADIEPMAMRFVQDQLRASPLLLYATVLDVLSRDAGQLAGIRHRVFGDQAGAVFTALNPGIARGILHIAPNVDDVEEFRPDGIYVLPETVSDLPPVRGILTAGAGNPLSHVQLLARNLGIPNATVSESFLPALAGHDGEHVVLAVSRAGVVEIAADGEYWDRIFLADTGHDDNLIKPDLQKLELDFQRLVPLTELGAKDSGRSVGPKAAKLGELKQHYPEAVSAGLAIPFGVFRKVALEQPHPEGGTVLEWMIRNYRTLGPVDPLDEKQAARYEAFRAELYDLIVNVPLGDSFRRQLEAALAETFGDGPTPGLFVRSDTNVEDLAGFTGAGLNLTLPNVVGIDALLEAIPRVWASPFTERAFAWRQSRMTDPEHVYTSILLLESVASDKSGVLVTADIDSGARDVVSVAVNEGLGGAVDGQAAESLRINRQTGAVRVFATASAPTRRVPSPSGGLDYVAASGSDTVLEPEEIRQLLEFVDSLPQRFPPIVDDEGKPAPADVEFGFLAGELQLFQLRPFLESRYSAGSDYLADMDAGLTANAAQQVDMQKQPTGRDPGAP